MSVPCPCGSHSGKHSSRTATTRVLERREETNMRKSDLTVGALAALALGVGIFTGGAGTASAAPKKTTTDTCGYPLASGTTKQTTVFNESEVLRSFQPAVS